MVVGTPRSDRACRNYLLVAYLGLLVATTPAHIVSWGPVAWPILLALTTAWSLAWWILHGPTWSVAGAALMGLAIANTALTARLPWVAGASLILLGGVLLTIAAGQHHLHIEERVRQAAYDAAEGTANTLRDATVQLATADRAIQQRLQRYAALRGMTESLSAQTADLDTLLKAIAQQALVILDHVDLALLYSVEPPRHELALRAVHARHGSPPVIKHKTGDLYDQWVLRQGQPLLVRDVRRDFRFPPDAVLVDERAIGSLIAVPMISAQHLLGILRIERATADSLTAEDLRLMSVAADIGSMAIENMRLYQRTAELAVTDDLTGLAVHRYFHERLEEELVRARHRQGTLAVLLIDIDHFKVYNDTYGHPAGDKLLRSIAQILRRWQASGDLVARYGGEEFAVLIPDATPQHAASVAEEIRATIAAQEFLLRQGIARVTVSIGVALFPQDGGPREALLQVTDQRLYRAKTSGRNRVCVGS